MKIPIFLLFSMFKIYIQLHERGQVYRCNDGSYVDEQCLTHEKIGQVDFFWLKKCKGAKVCIKLPYYGEMAGVCSIKVRSHYDGESCQKDNKCTSKRCVNSKCKGLEEESRCQPGLGQCQKGFVCRKKTTNSTFHQCLSPIVRTENCKGLIDILKVDDGFIDYEYSQYYLPENNVCELGYVCNEICIPIHSIGNGGTATNPLACSSGTIYSNSNKCVIYPNANNTCTQKNGKYVCENIFLDGYDGNVTIDCLKTSQGAYWCPTSAISIAFDEWYSEWFSYSENQDDTNIEAYRYTANKKSVNELFFRYKYFGLITDADECSYDYFWKNNFSMKLKISVFIFILIFLF
jgi:hypothetical protein